MLKEVKLKRNSKDFKRLVETLGELRANNLKLAFGDTDIYYLEIHDKGSYALALTNRSYVDLGKVERRVWWLCVITPRVGETDYWDLLKKESLFIADEHLNREQLIDQLKDSILRLREEVEDNLLTKPTI